MNAPELIGSSPLFQAAIETAKRAAPSHANIFISGESGTGKELFASFIHSQSKRKSHSFVAINCAAIPEHLLESELFGHAKGSFTGAIHEKKGLFEEAEGGTLFLDEIGDLSLNLQAKLLRVLQEKKIKRVGENHMRSCNTRIISATHRNLGEEVYKERFREDLFYRLSVIPLHLPPLRDRVEDILPLAEKFLRTFALENLSPAKRFSSDGVKYLLENHWRGNVRELENLVERAVIMTRESEVSFKEFVPSVLDSYRSTATDDKSSSGKQFVLDFEFALPTLDLAVQKYIEFAVMFNGGAKDRTAKEIGIDRKTLYKRLNREHAELSPLRLL